MFWKKSAPTTDKKSQPYWLLNTVRSPQEFVAWKDFEPSLVFSPHFKDSLISLVQLRDELIYIESLNDLLLVIEEFEQEINKGKERLKLHYVDLFDNAYVISPHTEGSWFEDVLHVRFYSLEKAKNIFEQYRQTWLRDLEDDALLSKLTKAVKKYAKKKVKEFPEISFEELLSIIDASILQQDQITSELYLSQVLGVPKSIWTVEPEQAMVVRLNVQRQFQKMREELVQLLKSEVQTLQLRLRLFGHWSQAELDTLHSLTEHELTRLHQEFIQVLKKHGVSEETLDLVGYESFRERLSNLDTEKIISTLSPQVQQVVKFRLRK